jgi:hypothetical protein
MANNTEAPAAAPEAPVVDTPAAAPAPLAGTMIDESKVMSVQGEMVRGPKQTVTVKTAFGHELAVKTN